MPKTALILTGLLLGNGATASQNTMMEVRAGSPALARRHLAAMAE
jgi:hypothetical protein